MRTRNTWPSATALRQKVWQDQPGFGGNVTSRISLDLAYPFRPQRSSILRPAKTLHVIQQVLSRVALSRRLL